MIEGISAITLGTHDMARAVRFYRVLGFDLLYGGEAAAFTSFRAGQGYLNLTAQPADKLWSWWGRAIFYVDDVDALHEKTKGNLAPEEDGLLLDLLGKLKMTYLEINQAMAAEMAKAQGALKAKK